MMRVLLNNESVALSPNVRVLLVQDQRASAQAIRDHAEQNSHRYHIDIKQTSSGAKALELARTWEPAVIVVDAFLSDTNSFELLEHIKTHPTPVLITGPDHSAEIEESAKNHGAAAYMSSSEDPDILDQLLGEIVRLAKTHGIEQ